MKIQDIVKINRQAMIDNGSEQVELDINEYFEIIRVLDIGERAYNLRGVDSENKVFVREDEEYAFVDEELELWNHQKVEIR